MQNKIIAVCFFLFWIVFFGSEGHAGALKGEFLASAPQGWAKLAESCQQLEGKVTILRVRFKRAV